MMSQKPIFNQSFHARRKPVLPSREQDEKNQNSDQQDLEHGSASLPNSVADGAVASTAAVTTATAVTTVTAVTPIGALEELDWNPNYPSYEPGKVFL
jgi:uncharacterized protein (UPF0147 family)